MNTEVLWGGGCGGGLLGVRTYGGFSVGSPVVARAIITMAVRTELGMVCHASIKSLRSLSIGGSPWLLSEYDAGEL